MTNTIILTAMVLVLMALAALPRLWSEIRRRVSGRTHHHHRPGAHL